MNVTIDNCLIADFQETFIASCICIFVTYITIDCTTADFCDVIVIYAIVIALWLSEYASLNLQLAVIIILNRDFTTSALREITIVNGHNRILPTSVFATIIPTIVNQAGKCTCISVRELKRTLVDS